MAETSIIIRTYNEEALLPALFDRLAAQTYQDVETIVVDSGSIDRTRAIAQERADRLVRIRQQDFTFGYSANVGIRNSQGRYLVIVSAHALPTGPDWLTHLIAALREEQTAMVYGRQEGHQDSKLGEARDFRRTFGGCRQVLTSPRFFANNANAALRRELWEQHPFDERLPGLEDIEWAKHWMQQGYQVIYEPAASVCHLHRETWPQVFRRYYREAQAAKTLGLKQPWDVTGEAWRELRYLIGDLAHAWHGRCLQTRGAEIAQFRWQKFVGTATGLWNGHQASNESAQARLLFRVSYPAVVIRGPGQASLEQLELPLLKPSEVLIRVAYEGVCATDLDILDGTLGYYRSGQASYPVVPGHECSGVIAASGSRVTEWAEGDRVVVECLQGCGECAVCRAGDTVQCPERQEVGVIGHHGGYADYLIVPARCVHRLPDQVSLKAAALCEPLAVVLKGLRRLESAWGPSGPKSCAVIGAGPIGHLVAQVLARRGHHVIVVDQRVDRLRLLTATNMRSAQGLDSLRDVSVIIEATGDPDSLERILRQSAPGSTILLLGLPYARRPYNFEDIVGSDKTLIGSVASAGVDFEEAINLLPTIDTTALLQHTLPMQAFEHAWQLARARTHLKVILAVNPTTDVVPSGA